MWLYNRTDKRFIPVPEVPVKVDILGKGFQKLLTARDISLGGIGIFIPNDFRGNDVGNEIQIKVFIPEREEFTVFAEIRHSELDNTFIGVKFIGLTKEVKNVIKGYISEIRPE